MKGKIANFWYFRVYVIIVLSEIFSESETRYEFDERVGHLSRLNVTFL
jgi:hypothetical protein